jgi:Cu2+-containing amine oxidase
MAQNRVLKLILLGAGIVLAALAPALAQQQPGRRPDGAAKGASKPTAAPANETIVEFPTNDVMRTAWKVQWSTMNGFGLVINGAWFKKGPKEPWFQVLADARLSEMFVPYHSGSPRFWDVSYNFSLVTLTKNDAGPFGRLIGSPPVVCQEIRDRGIAWVDGTQGSRRGQTMVLWSCLNAANYRYLIEYGFQDDAALTFRVGSTGRNYSSREFEGHMHNGLWRVGVNLDGSSRNSVYIMEHVEPADADRAKAKTVHRAFNEGREGYEDWDASRFTMVSVRSETRKNARNEPVAYDFMTPRTGNARHFGNDEECTHHDFWATKNRAGEIYYQKLPKYVAKGESIRNADVVVWLSTAAHHEPRSEDGEMKKDNFTGVTPVMWSGFEMKPRNFWDRSPLYP